MPPRTGEDWMQGLTLVALNRDDGREYVLPVESQLGEAIVKNMQTDPTFMDELLETGYCESTVTFTYESIRNVKGMFDHLLCRPTMAAYRYVRSQKRKKEKERRAIRKRYGK